MVGSTVPGRLTPTEVTEPTNEQRQVNHWRNDADVESDDNELATEAVQLRAQMTSAEERRQSTEPADYNKMTSLLRKTPTVILLISAAAAQLAGVGPCVAPIVYARS